MLVTVIADASFDHGTGAGGYGYWAVSGRGRRYGGGPFKSTSGNNNITEMMALINGVHQAFVHGIAQDGDAILAQSDCQAAILAFENQRARLHPEEKRLVEAMRKLMAVHKATIRYRYVKGHTTGTQPRNWVNNLCDEFAGRGMREARDRIRQAAHDPEPALTRSAPK